MSTATANVSSLAGNDPHHHPHHGHKVVSWDLPPDSQPPHRGATASPRGHTHHHHHAPEHLIPIAEHAPGGGSGVPPLDLRQVQADDDDEASAADTARASSVRGAPLSGARTPTTSGVRGTTSGARTPTSGMKTPTSGTKTSTSGSKTPTSDVRGTTSGTKTSTSGTKASTSGGANTTTTSGVTITLNLPTPRNSVGDEKDLLADGGGDSSFDGGSQSSSTSRASPQQQRGRSTTTSRGTTPQSSADSSRRKAWRTPRDPTTTPGSVVGGGRTEPSDCTHLALTGLDKHHTWSAFHSNRSPDSSPSSPKLGSTRGRRTGEVTPEVPSGATTPSSSFSSSLRNSPVMGRKGERGEQDWGRESRSTTDDFSNHLSPSRCFTAKRLRKTVSSTTLSSTTEASDDNGDGNFHVVLRVRPLSSQEKQRRDQFAATFPGDGQCAVDNSGSQRHFQFNVVFEPDAVQEDVFENCGIRKLVDNAVLGYTCTAFAFGQTGSGKTHTMTGPPSQVLQTQDKFHQVGVTPDPKMYGIIQRSFKYMFQQIKQQGGGKVIRASYLEIYNEQVIDLLNNSHRRYLSVRWSKNKGFYVENLFTVECETLDDLMAVLEEGLRNRQTGSHGLNEFSSRSHSVLTVTIDSETQPDTEDENLFVTKRGKLSFVDLAGSEKVKDASGGTGGPGMLESNSINKSLLVLGNCISHLGDAKRRQGHIPYRDSKLTKLLSDSLGGNGITLMIACIAPSSTNITETMNTLRYASRAKKIKSKPTVKMDPREKLIVNLKREIKVLRNENHYLRQQLDFPAKPKGQLQKENDEKFMKFMKEQKEKESGLYEMLQEYMVENENLRAENSEMHSMRDRIRREQQLLYRENEKLMKRVEEMERVMSQNPGMWSQQGHPRRTDGYGQYDLVSPRTSPVAAHPPPPGFHSGHKHPQPTHGGFQGSPPGSRGGKGGNPPGPMKPPHRLPDPVMRPAQRPAELLENGAVYAAANNGYASPRGGMPRQNAIHSMNEQLKREVQQLEGQIRHHQYVHERTSDLARSNGSNSVR